MQLLTNSIASTNQMSVHAFDKKTTDQLTKAESLAIYSASAGALLGLHAKTMMVDAETSFVGTFNNDPRSTMWNSETGVVIESEAFAKHLLKCLARDFEPANSWLVRIEENGRMVWEGEQGEQAVELRDEPRAIKALTLKSWLFGILPIAD